MSRISKIVSLRVRAVQVPMTEPHRTATGVISVSPLVLVDVATDGGVTGHGVIFTYTVAALGPTARLTANLEEFITGESLAPAAVTAKLNRRFRLLGTQGLVGMAIAGIDMAMWDALARMQGLPLARALGSEPKPIQAYGAIGYDGEAQSARTAEEWLQRGFRGVKAKIGYPDPAEDVAVVGAIRRAAGPDAAIMVDYNQCLAPAEAIHRIRALEEFKLTWVEEPMLAHDFGGHAAIAREVDTPIQCGENWWGPLDFRHAVEAQASDYMMPEAMKTGGVSGWRDVAAIAATHGIPISSHLWPEVSAQLLSASPTAHWLEYSGWWNPILSQPLEVHNGLAQPSERPGSGIEWNEEAVERFAAQT